jgi:hypothetical protein
MPKFVQFSSHGISLPSPTLRAEHRGVLCLCSHCSGQKLMSLRRFSGGARSLQWFGKFMMLCLLQSEDGEWYSTVLPKSKRMKASRCAAVRASVPLGLRSPAVGSLTRGPYLIAGPTCQKPYWQEAVPLSLAAPPDVIYCDTVFSLDLVRIRGPFIRTGREQDSAWALSAPWSNSTGRSPAVPLAPHWPWTWRAEPLSANSGAILFGRSCSCSTDSTCRKMSI